MGFHHVERGVEQFTQLGGPQHLPWASIPNKTSLCQKQHPFHLWNDRVDPMGDLHHGGSRLDQAPQDRQQLMAGLEVEGTARLIQHQHLRLVNQGASDQQAAPLSVR